MKQKWVEAMALEVVGKIKSFDFKKPSMTIQLAFLNEELIQKLEKFQGETKFTKIKLNETKSVGDELSNSVRNRWFAVLTTILEWQDIRVTPEVLTSFHHVMKESEFEIRKFIIDGKTIPLVPSINILTDKEVNDAINRLILRYSELGCSFEEG